MGTAAANTEANARDIMMANADFILSLVTESMCVRRVLYLLRLLNPVRCQAQYAPGGGFYMHKRGLQQVDTHVPLIHSPPPHFAQET